MSVRHGTNVTNVNVEDRLWQGASAALTAPGAAPAEGRPGRPPIVLAAGDAEADSRGRAVDLRVRVPAGLGAPARFRLRRGLSATREPQRMPIIAEGDLPAAGPCAAPLVSVRRGAERTEIVLRDEALPPWQLLCWAVEVQCAAPPGALSAAIALVSSAVIPEAAPAAPAAIIAARSGGAVALLILHPEGASLLDTPMGPHAIEIYRAAEGRPARLDVPVRRAADLTFTAIDPAPPAGAAIYAVRVVDPLGRPGRFATSPSV